MAVKRKLWERVMLCYYNIVEVFMMFALGFFTGIAVIYAYAFYKNESTRKERIEEAEYQARKDELLVKALPVYSQVREILQKDELEPQRIASLMFIAKLVEDSMEQELSKTPPSAKEQ